MQSEKMLLPTTALTMLGLLWASCVPAASPTPTSKPAVPAPKVETPVSKPPAPAAAPSPSPKPATAEPRYGGTLKVAQRGDPPHFDPMLSPTIALFAIVGGIYSGILQHDPTPGKNENIIADLAEKWVISPDGKVYTFYFRKGVKWHDGKPFTAEDARYTYDRIKNPPPKLIPPSRQSLLEGVDKIETPDENTLKITLTDPSAVFLGTAAMGRMVVQPRHIMEAKFDMRKEDDSVGTGPFRFKRFVPGVLYELVKNPDYFVRGLPYVDGIQFYIIRDASSRFAAFRTGQIDLTAVGRGTYLSASEAEAVKREMPGAVAYEYPALSNFGLVPFFEKAPWSDFRVRQAANLAIDRQAAIKVVGQGYGKVGGALVPGTEWAIPEPELVKRPGYRQPKDADIAEARKLLAEAGFANGFKTQMIVRAGVDDVQSEFAQHELRKVGIEAEMVRLEQSVWEARLLKKDFEVFTQGNSLNETDPDDIARYYVSGSPSNRGWYSDPKVDDLFRRQRRTLDIAERKKIVREVELKLLDEMPLISIAWESGIRGASARVRNWEPGLGNFNNNTFQALWLAK
ncbi:MAG: ABC transporter substrate-binding protein [Chloroflexi bacterium]|nr:ABC transporter substrate-binding protein [Chloroflexota bacterium]